MPPFNGHPQGFSASALALLDQGLNEIWHEMQIAADARTKTAAQAVAAAGLLPGADVHDQRALPVLALKPDIAAIVK